MCRSHSPPWSFEQGLVWRLQNEGKTVLPVWVSREPGLAAGKVVGSEGLNRPRRQNPIGDADSSGASNRPWRAISKIPWSTDPCRLAEPRAASPEVCTWTSPGRRNAACESKWRRGLQAVVSLLSEQLTCRSAPGGASHPKAPTAAVA